MATGRVPTTANSPLTAKGDLFGYSTTQARVPVGSDGETLVADSSTSTGLRYNPQNALANPFINGGFDIWQRGTSFSVTGGNLSFYTADRWQAYRAVSGLTVSRQTTSDTTNLPNIQYGGRFQRDSGNTATNLIYAAYSMENVQSTPLIGKTFTLSFYAKRGANYSESSNNLLVSLGTGTGTDQNFISGFTNYSSTISQNVTLTTTYQRFAITGTFSSTGTQIGMHFSYTPSGTAGANDWFEVTGVQIDLGTYTASSAPTFRRSGGTLAGEFQAAQRYFQKIGGQSAFESLGTGMAYSTTQAVIHISFQTAMRTTPSLSVGQGTSGNFAVYSATGVRSTLTSTSFQDPTPYSVRAITTTAANLVAGNATQMLMDNSTAGALWASAEL